MTRIMQKPKFGQILYCKLMNFDQKLKLLTKIDFFLTTYKENCSTNDVFL